MKRYGGRQPVPAPDVLDTPGDPDDQPYPHCCPPLRHDRHWDHLHRRPLYPVARLAQRVELGNGVLPPLADGPRRVRHPWGVPDRGIPGRWATEASSGSLSDRAWSTRWSWLARLSQTRPKSVTSWVTCRRCCSSPVHSPP